MLTQNKTLAPTKVDFHSIPQDVLANLLILFLDYKSFEQLYRMDRRNSEKLGQKFSLERMMRAIINGNRRAFTDLAKENPDLLALEHTLYSGPGRFFQGTPLQVAFHSASYKIIKSILLTSSISFTKKQGQLEATDASNNILQELITQQATDLLQAITVVDFKQSKSIAKLNKEINLLKATLNENSKITHEKSIFFINLFLNIAETCNRFKMKPDNPRATYFSQVIIMLLGYTPPWFWRALVKSFHHKEKERTYIDQYNNQKTTCTNLFSLDDYSIDSFHKDQSLTAISSFENNSIIIIRRKAIAVIRAFINEEELNLGQLIGRLYEEARVYEMAAPSTPSDENRVSLIREKKEDTADLAPLPYEKEKKQINIDVDKPEQKSIASLKTIDKEQKDIIYVKGKPMLKLVNINGRRMPVLFGNTPPEKKDKVTEERVLRTPGEQTLSEQTLSMRSTNKYSLTIFAPMTPAKVELGDVTPFENNDKDMADIATLHQAVIS